MLVKGNKMFIKSIELENIRSYKKEVVIFDTGINFLSGDIGSGKSTILLAIEFAFFGFKKGDLEGYELLRKGENKGSIKLVLEDKGNIIEIFRSVKKQKSSDMISQESGYIKDSNNLIELAPKELNAYIFDLLNFPKEFLTKNKNLVYRFSVYTPQEHLKSILFDTSESRLEVIRKIFGIDKYKQLLDSFDFYLKKIREDKKVLDVKIERKFRLVDELKVLDKKIKGSTDSITKLEVEDLELVSILKKYKDGIDKRDDLIDRLTNNLLILEKKKSVIEGYEEQAQNLKLEISDLLYQKKNFDKEKIEKKIEGSHNLILEKENELKKIGIQILDLKNFLKLKDSLIENIQKLEKEKIEFMNDKRDFDKLSSSFDFMLTKCQVKDLENFILKDKTRIKKLEKSFIEFSDASKRKIEIDLNLKSLELDFERVDIKIRDILELDFCECCLQKVSKEHIVDIEKNLKKEKSSIKDLINVERKALVFIEKSLKVLDKEVLELDILKMELIQKEEKIKVLYEKENNEKVLSEDLNKLKTKIESFVDIDFDKSLKELNEKVLEFKTKEFELEKLDLLDRKIIDEISLIRLGLKELMQKIIDYDSLDANLKKKEGMLLGLNDKVKSKKDITDKILDFRVREKQCRDDKYLLKGKYDVYLSKSSQVGRELVRVKTDLKSNVEFIKINEKELLDIEKVEKVYSKLQFNENFFRGSASEILLQIERNVFSKYYAEFNDEFEKLFRELIEDNDIDVRLNSEFSPVIEQNGYDIDVKNLSGGEKSSLAIAYRLGLKKIIESNFDSKQKLSLLILDEPTDGFSNEQIDRLGNILKDTKLKQIILVSHDEKIENIADRVLYVEKVNHVSRIV